MLITFQQFKTSLQAMKRYIDNIIPKKVSDLNNDLGFGTYSKPNDGIPKADLSSEVQTSLGKADTALQSAPVTSVNNKTGAVNLSASDVGALPDSTEIPTVPTNISAFTNDAGYLTSYTETDPTVPNWAKQTNKPTYTAQEVGALPSNTEIHNIPSGGSTGQMLVKKSNTNYDTEWTEAYSLPQATDSTLGGVKIGSGISISQNGVISIPTPMQFKGTVGTGGTETSLPSAAAANTSSN